MQINLPKSLSRDYLANVTLYHELGHFIDTKFKISHTLAEFVLKGGIFNTNVLGKYIDLSQPQNYAKIQSYFAEYFCDIFASQYIGDRLDIYLSHITNYSKSGFDSLTHPSTSSRNEIVKDFLTSSNEFIDYIKVVCTKTTEVNLEKRYKKFDLNEIFSFFPLEMANNQKDSIPIYFRLGGLAWRCGEI